LVGNGLTPGTIYGYGSSVSTDNTGSGLYGASRSSVYTWPDNTQNKAHLLSFNIQHVLDAQTELATTAYFKYGTQSRLGGDINGILSSSGLINRNNTSQTTLGVSTNLTKMLNDHQITSGASLERSKMGYRATETDGCTVSSDRQIYTDDCTSSALTTAGVIGITTAFGTYLGDTYKLNDKTFVTVAGRFNQTTVANTLSSYDTGTLTSTSSESFTYRKFNPSLGMTYQLASPLTLFGNWAQSNRAPTILELGCADSANPCALPTGLQSDPFLSQVVSQTIEGGMRWKNDFDYSLSVSAYRTINKNDIIFISQTTTTGYFDNFDKTQHKGLDINVNKSWGRWKLNTTYSYLKATYESYASLLGVSRTMSITPGMRMAGLPMYKLKIHLDWSATENWNIGSSLIASSSLVSQGNEDGYITSSLSGNAKVNGYALFNLNTTYTVQKGFELFGKINNVFNKRYETYGMISTNYIENNATDSSTSKFVAPGAPRTFMAGLRYRF
jgi:outer membrane receptor protein involved in Fe transport